MIMRGLRKYWGLGFKKRNRPVLHANAFHPDQIQAYLPDDFGNKFGHSFPEKGWHLHGRVNVTGTNVVIDEINATELDDDIIDRIDLLACLFGAKVK